MASASDCPCGSGQPYRACCRAFHRGEREPADAPTLVRARYAAFALKELDFLWRTLDAEHPDRARPEAEVRRELRDMGTHFKFPGVQVLDQAPPDERGVARVLFLARLYERGKDRSFVERSELRHDGTGWRYRAGVTHAAGALGAPAEALTLESFTKPS